MNSNQPTFPTAYVVTTNTQSDRYCTTRSCLQAAGISVIPSIVPWDDDELLRRLPARNPALSEAENKSHLSISLAHFRAWQAIARDPLLGENGWGLVFEDDVKVHDSVEPRRIQDIMSRFFPELESGFAYFGLCRPREFGDRRELEGHPDIETVYAAGPCTHAYAIQKQKAACLYDRLVLEFGESQLFDHPLDNRLKLYWHKHKGVPLCGINLAAPNDSGRHRGLFFQDRKSFQSILAEIRRRSRIA